MPVTSPNILHTLSHLISIISVLQTSKQELHYLSNILLKKNTNEKWGYKIVLGKNEIQSLGLTG